ncbi:MAG: DUF4102 domain-containing protein [Rhodobacteraceae bacterium]|nr:DUF4102 domain-containing protein [Paracoccaceae bacterium]
MPLSDIKIRNLKSGDKAYKVSDFEGLFILVKVSGAKSWRFKYRIDGKERLLVIGDYPAVTNPMTTQRYAHLADDPLRDAAEVMAGK